MNKLDLGVYLKQQFLFKQPGEAEAKHGHRAAIGDFDRNGVHDLVIAFGAPVVHSEITNNPAQFFLGVDGGLVYGSQIVTVNAPQLQSNDHLVAVDANLDGVTDVFIPGSNSESKEPYEDLRSMMLISEGDKFQGSYLEEPDYYHHVRAADVNGDGYPDVLFPGIGGNSYFVMGGATPYVTDATIPNNLLRNPNWDVLERYPEPNTWIKTALWRQTQTINFVDANRDGHPDLLLLPKADPHHLLFLNDGTGDFSKSAELRVDAAVPGFEQWGRYAEFVPSSGPDPYEIVDNPVPTKGINYYGSLTYDVNGDGWEDLINSGPYIDSFRSGNEFNNEQLIQILINDGALFRNETSERITQIEYDLELDGHQGYVTYDLVDVNGDGHMDLMLSRTSSGDFDPLSDAIRARDGSRETVFYINDGRGYFTESLIEGLPNSQFKVMPIDGKLAFVSNVVKAEYRAELAWPWDTSSNITQFDIWLTDTPWTRGDEGNNFLHGTTISEAIDGGAGTDTLVVLGRSSQYDLEIAANKPASIRGLDGMSGTDTLTSVERIKFYDTALAFDTDGVAGQAYRIYKAAFDRVPDLPGLGYWIGVMDAGASLTGVAGGFIASAEFQSRYGLTVDNRDFVTLLYNNVLDRDPETEGFEYWNTVLNNGASRSGVLVGFSESIENQLNVADLISSGIEYTPYIN